MQQITFFGKIWSISLLDKNPKILYSSYAQTGDWSTCHSKDN